MNLKESTPVGALLAVAVLLSSAHCRAQDPRDLIEIGRVPCSFETDPSSAQTRPADLVVRVSAKGEIHFGVVSPRQKDASLFACPSIRLEAGFAPKDLTAVASRLGDVATWAKSAGEVRSHGGWKIWDWDAPRTLDRTYSSRADYYSGGIGDSPIVDVTFISMQYLHQTDVIWTPDTKSATAHVAAADAQRLGELLAAAPSKKAFDAAAADAERARLKPTARSAFRTASESRESPKQVVAVVTPADGARLTSSPDLGAKQVGVVQKGSKLSVRAERAVGDVRYVYVEMLDGALKGKNGWLAATDVAIEK